MPTEGPMDRGTRAGLVTRAELPTAHEKLLLLLLDAYSGQRDRCWPSIDLLARKASCSRRTAQRSIRSLVAQGFVAYASPPPGRSRRMISSRAYQIDYGALAVAEQRREALARREATESAPLDSGGATGTPPDDVPHDDRTRECQADTGAPGTPLGVPEGHPWGCQGDALQQARTLSVERSKRAASDNGREQRLLAIGDAADFASAAQRAKPALIHLGVARNRIDDLCRRAGTSDRIAEILAMIRSRADRIGDPARYFASACTHPDWRPNPEERTLARQIHDQLTRTEP